MDLIDRQTAIDALTRKMVSIPTAGEKDLMGDVNRIRAEDISVIKRLPSAQPVDKDINVSINDCISRQAVIEINRSYHGQMPNEVNHRIWKEINDLPPAQPEKRTEERTETHACDLISIKDAIRIVDSIDTWQAGWRGNAIESLKAIPSAQPETHEERTETHACDCIERKAVIRWVKTECNPYGKPTLDFESGKKVIEHLKQMPPALPEIVRCKDCRYYQDNNGGYPHMNCKWDANETPDADDFCSGAERRTDE